MDTLSNLETDPVEHRRISPRLRFGLRVVIISIVYVCVLRMLGLRFLGPLMPGQRPLLWSMYIAMVLSQAFVGWLGGQGGRMIWTIMGSLILLTTPICIDFLANPDVFLQLHRGPLGFFVGLFEVCAVTIALTVAIVTRWCAAAMKEE